MPGGNRTGPNGLGSRTGRRMGFCSGFDSPGYANQGFGGRNNEMGFGRGGGRGFGIGFGRGARGGFWNNQLNQNQQTPIQQPTKEQEKQILEQELKQLDEEESSLKNEKEDIKNRLNELNK